MNDGGPAFARDTKWGLDGAIIQEGSKGMSLRDYFAAKAIASLLAHHGDAGWHPDGQVQSMSGAAQTAYAYADAMIEERSKK